MILKKEKYPMKYCFQITRSWFCDAISSSASFSFAAASFKWRRVSKNTGFIGKFVASLHKVISLEFQSGFIGELCSVNLGCF